MFFPCSRKPLANGLLSILSFVILKWKEQDSASQWLVGVFTIPRSSVFITTDKLCEGFGLVTVSQLSQQPPSLIRNWPTERSDLVRVSRDLGGIHLTREIHRTRICIWTCSHTFYCICSVSLTVHSIPSRCMTHLITEGMFSTGTTMCLFLPTGAQNEQIGRRLLPL